MKRGYLQRGTSQLKRSGFKKKSFEEMKLMKRGTLNKVGRVGKANRNSLQKIAEISESLNLNYCEVQLEGCLRNTQLEPAHRFPRAYYKGDEELLADYKQWICACRNCHNILDRRTDESRELTESVFMRLRGEE